MNARELGLRYRDARRARKMKQEELAEAVGVSLGTIQNLELGKRETHRATLIKIGQVLDLPGDEDEARALWEPDVQAILNMIGTWLMSMSEAERMEFNLEMVRRRFGVASMAQGVNGDGRPDRDASG